MASNSPNRNIRSLDPVGLERLALHYVGRYATTRAKLSAYLIRKIGERDWRGETPEKVVAALVERFAERGYADDRAFAEARAAGLARRGYGARRVSQALRHAGISEEDSAPARSGASDNALAAALAFARRRRIGPFAPEPADKDARRRALAALIRAGHPFDLARRIVLAAPGEEIATTPQ